MLRAKLFGAPQLSLQDRPFIPGLSGRGLALFAYVATHPELSSRSVLIDLLWSEKTEAQGRENLRGLLYTMRQSVGDYLIITRQTVAFNRHASYWMDIEIFDRYLTANQSAIDPLLHTQILQLYQGEFLNGFYVQNAPVFETWLAAQRQYWHTLALQGWQQLVNYYLDQAQYQAGLAATRQLLILEPWQEEAHRQQMIMLARSGQQNAALAQYERCCQILRDEMDAPPSSATTLLYEQIKAGHWSPSFNASIQVIATENATVGNVTAGNVTVDGFSNGEKAPQNDTNGAVGTPGSLTERPPSTTLIDWGMMPRESRFYGRQSELGLLYQWAIAEKARIIAILGVGGQGKTALAAHFVQTLAESGASAFEPLGFEPLGFEPLNFEPLNFERIIWRSLLAAPLLTDLLADWLQQLSNQQVVTLSNSLEQQFTLLHKYLQDRRFLLVLDNVESILLDDGSGACRPGYEPYEQLCQIFMQRDHRCCLLLTSRERPRQLSNHAEQSGALRTLRLDGLSLSDGQQLLRKHHIAGQETAIAALLHCYSGNPLALTLVADAIDELFAGDLDTFLQEETPFFADIGAVLDQQFARLAPLERELLTWLALEQEPVSSQTLWDNLVAPPAKRDYLTALRALVRRSLVQPQGDLFGLQNVILEHTRNRLVNAIGEALTTDKLLTLRQAQGASDLGYGEAVRDLSRAGELAAEQPVLLSDFNRYALLKAQAKAYVRTGQRRLVLEPIARRLQQYWGQQGVATLYQALLTELRTTRQTYPPLANGYAVGNILHLLLQMNVELQEYDFSHLTLRQAYLRNVTLRDVGFAAANLQDCLFTDVFAAITALAFHPSGEWLAIGTFDGTIRLVRLADHQVHSILLGHTNAIFGLAISPDGVLLASSSSDQQVRVWDLQTKTLRYNFLETINFVRTVVFSPDNRWLAVGGGDGTVKIYTATSGQLQYTLQSTHAWVCAVAFSPDGQWLAGGGQDGAISLWPIRALTTPIVLAPMCMLTGHAIRVETLIFSHDSQLLFSGARDHLIHIWQLPDAIRDLSGQDAGPGRTPWRTLYGHRDSVRRLALSPNGRYLASGGSDALVYLWDVREGALLDTLVGHEQWVWSVAFHPRPVGDSYLLASAGNDQRVLLWEINMQEGISHSRLHQTLSGYSDAVRSLAFLPQSHLLVSGGFDKLVHIWDSQRDLDQVTLRAHRDWIFSVAVSPDGQWIASAGYERLIYLWSFPKLTAADGDQVAVGAFEHGPAPPRVLEGPAGIISGLAFSPDGQILASCSQDGLIYLWHVQSGQRLQTLTWQSCLAWSIAFSPDGRLLASANFDNTVRLWDVQDLADHERPASTRLRQTFTGHTGLVWMVAFSPDGQTVISTSNDQTVRLWDVGGQQPRVLTGHTSTVRGLAVNPQMAHGRFTLATSDDKLICIWDGQSGELLHRWQGHQGGIHTLAYSSDGATLASASEQGDIRLWDGQTGVLSQTLRPPRPYAGMDITGVTGITAAQKAALLALGAVEKA